MSTAAKTGGGCLRGDNEVGRHHSVIFGRSGLPVVGLDVHFQGVLPLLQGPVQGDLLDRLSRLNPLGDIQRGILSGQRQGIDKDAVSSGLYRAICTFFAPAGNTTVPKPGILVPEPWELSTRAEGSQAWALGSRAIPEDCMVPSR